MNIQIIRHDVVGSTNDEALNHARAGAKEGLCIIANKQTAGRGREGREWFSEDGVGLYISIVMKPELESYQLPVLTLLCAIAVHDTVAELTGAKPDIKWPNDVLVDGKKISGILLETCETVDGTAVVAGIGLNMDSSKMPDGVRVMSTSLNSLAKDEVGLTESLNTLLQNIKMRYADLMNTKNTALILGEWSGRSSYAIGKKVAVSMRHTSFFGETMGLDPSGSLLVRRENTGQVVAVTAGDVNSVREDNRSEEEVARSADEEISENFANSVNSDQLCDDENVLEIEKVQ